MLPPRQELPVSRPSPAALQMMVAFLRAAGVHLVEGDDPTRYVRDQAA